MSDIIGKLLWPFASLPENYCVLDTETTGLVDSFGPPGIVTIGMVMVCNGEITEENEFKVKPHRTMTEGATKIHGITDEECHSYPLFVSQWPSIKKKLDERLIIIHNASYDWPVLLDHIKRYQVSEPTVRGVFCSQRSAQPWSVTAGLKCSERGPSLDTLTAALGVKNYRNTSGGLHGALIDARQTAMVVQALKEKCK